MENASKALIMAGAVLLAMMILGIGVYLFMSAGSLSASYEERLAQDKINGFNSKFLIYQKKINAQEMVSLINLVNENNIKNPDKQIQIFINGENVQNNSSKYNEDYMISMMQSTDINQEGIYECKTIEHNSAGYIKTMKFKT